MQLREIQLREMQLWECSLGKCSSERCSLGKCSLGKCSLGELSHSVLSVFKTCGVRSSIWDMLRPEEQEFWCERVPLRKQLGVLQCFCPSKTVDKTADDVHLSANTVQGLYHRFVTLISEHQTKENEALRVGAEDVEVEADEIAFRCTGVRILDGTFGVEWICYFGMTARGSWKVFFRTGSCEAQVKEEGVHCLWRSSRRF
jgi:hypothetical protein